MSAGTKQEERTGEMTTEELVEIDQIRERLRSIYVVAFDRINKCNLNCHQFRIQAHNLENLVDSTCALDSILERERD